MKKETSSILPDLGPSLGQFLEEEQQQFPDFPKALPRILHAMAAAGKVVNEVVRRLDLAGMIGSQGAYNFSGEEQQNLDIMAHDCFVRMLAATEEVCAVISEEAADTLAFTNSGGNYIIALDPLDGSPNIDVNAAIGTIFSVYQRRSSQSMPVQQADVLQAGNKQLAAGYLLYGTSTSLLWGNSFWPTRLCRCPKMDPPTLSTMATSILSLTMCSIIFSSVGMITMLLGIWGL
jgi:fructose-1,6-bisphosphatase I